MRFNAMKLSSLIPALTRAQSAGLLLTMFALAGCGREDIKVYRIAKASLESAPMSAQGGASGSMGGAAAQPRLTWKTPAGWTELPTSQMRVASFSIKSPEGRQASVSVIPLAGGAGGDLANVNRWRDQVGQPPVAAEELAKLGQNVVVAGQTATLYDIAGKDPASAQPARILAAVQHRDGAAWFFKMTGDDQLVAEQKSAFIEFLKSTKFASDASAPAASMADGPLPAGHPTISSTPPPAPAASGGGKPGWQAPAAWKEIPAGQMLVAKYSIAGDAGAKAELNIGTAMGGVAANVNRWRGQLGLAPLDEGSLLKDAASVDVQDGKATIIDLIGTDGRTGQSARILGAIVPRSNETWFYKLMGDPGVVAAQQEAFTKFVQTVKY
jgi:hypothetical protein